MTKTLLALAALLLASAPATAAPVFEILGAPGGRHAFTARVVGAGPATSYFNPALLPSQPKRFSLDFLAVFGLLDIDLYERPAEADIGPDIYDARVVTPDGSARLDQPALPTASLRHARGSRDPAQYDVFMGLGNTSPFLEGRLAFGLYALFPLKRFQAHRPFFVDEREQSFSNSLHFELFEDRLEMAGFVFALGGKPLDWLSLGAGFTLWTATTPSTWLYIPDAGNQEDSQINSTTEIRFRVTPHFGLVVEPWRGLRLTATAHLAAESTVKGKTDIQFWTYPYPEGQDSLVHDFGYTYGFLPLRLGFGAAWQQEGEALSWNVAASVLWAQWSAYRDRHGDRPAAWSDTVTVALSGELDVAGHRLGLDLQWAPSPVPAQRGRQNYVDNDRLGASLSWEKSWPVGPIALGAGVQAQAQWLLPREVRKDPAAIEDEFPSSVNVITGEPIASSEGLQSNNPGYPGFASDGWLLSVALSAHVYF